jgi:hypothetical protein
MNLYDELLPYWVASCKGIRDANRDHGKWVDYLKENGLTREWLEADRHVPIVTPDGQYYCGGCIVQGVMLFTWEAGVEGLDPGLKERGGNDTRGLKQYYTEGNDTRGLKQYYTEENDYETNTRNDTGNVRSDD